MGRPIALESFKAQSASGKEAAEGLESAYLSKKREILREVH